MKELYENGNLELEAPSLLAFEVASAMRFHPKIRLTLSQFEGAIGALGEMQIMREPSEAEWTAAFRLSLENPVSIYDAAYLSFALSRGAKMVTADKSFLAKLKSLQGRRCVVLLGELPT